MFIGHFGIAFILSYFFPSIPLWIFLTAVSFPDLLWPILVLIGKEKVTVNKNNPFMSDVKFESYPYSHSLILSSLFYSIPAIIFSVILGNILIFPLFLIGTASHWFLDYLYHMHDMPIKGFGKDEKVGLSMWKNGPMAFFIELIFYIVTSILFLPSRFFLSAIEMGLIFHLANSNSFFGYIKKNSLGGYKTNAIMVFVGYFLFIILGGILI
ncbi:hypothetical protein EWF20_04990 [Sulfolobus sp. S-194]|uniref:hypothetical protein n=1 Tax=Sulfolobus sp. S-194 TaxID=2512240 RepID=UPI0014372E76|nr:hypothetical protein [Sulfolobus sp. S-194]QIW23576.1 hypothetical protein EWF20_04990 [Sulfolobus sp. S-194]